MRQSVNSPYPWRRDPRWGNANIAVYHPTAVVEHPYLENTRRSVFYISFVAVAGLYAINYHQKLSQFLRKPGAFVINEQGKPMPIFAPDFMGQNILPPGLQDLFAKKPLSKDQLVAFKARMNSSVASGCV